MSYFLLGLTGQTKTKTLSLCILSNKHLLMQIKTLWLLSFVLFSLFLQVDNCVIQQSFQFLQTSTERGGNNHTEEVKRKKRRQGPEFQDNWVEKYITRINPAIINRRMHNINQKITDFSALFDYFCRIEGKVIWFFVKTLASFHVGLQWEHS